ncbi:MAG: 16S rRNA (cytosine(1402)-N(4))-methyltransferase RsmH [Planctomycetes bacterium]|nr:16S rRNA (cytosine(1402)-N(4))-methyltransferase RsmH [Planctomycetota bacterium]
MRHIPVMRKEVLELIDPRDEGLYLDLTLGAGGHARAILESSGRGSRLIGIDRDPKALEIARESLREFGDRVTFVHGRFGEVRELLTSSGVSAGNREQGAGDGNYELKSPLPLEFDGIVCDLGVSSMALDDADRGLSFQKPGPIDFRMDQSRGQTALEILKRISEEELADAIYEYGEERFSRRIAKSIKEAVARNSLKSTTDLAETIVRAMPRKGPGNINPATRTFQALRILVNDEMTELRTLLQTFQDFLSPSGACVIISFHSLEDREVKIRFKELHQSRLFSILTKKPLVPSKDEIKTNPRSRSAKLRGIRKLSQ